MRSGTKQGPTATTPTRRAVLGGGLLSAMALLWPAQPAAAASTVTVATLQAYREALSGVALHAPFALVDIRADWCGVCLRVERDVFPHPTVRRLLEDIALIKVDVTAMNEASRELLAYLRADGPPTFFVVDTASGAEYARTRSVGSLQRRDLIRRLQPFVRG
jgi:thiol:disulfide interchange protein